MEENNFFAIFKAIRNQSALFARLAGHFSELVRLEFQLAKQSLVWMLVLTLIAFSLFLTIWLSVNAILYFYLLTQFNHYISLMIVAIVNILLLGVVVFMMCKMKNNLLFPVTRRQVLSALKNPEENSHEKSAAENTRN